MDNCNIQLLDACGAIKPCDGSIISLCVAGCEVGDRRVAMPVIGSHRGWRCGWPKSLSTGISRFTWAAGSRLSTYPPFPDRWLRGGARLCHTAL